MLVPERPAGLYRMSAQEEVSATEDEMQVLHWANFLQQSQITILEG